MNSCPYNSLVRFDNALYQWYLIVDEYVSSILSPYADITVVDIHVSSNSSHGIQNAELNSEHMKLMMRKFDCCEYALENHDSVFFLDSDIFFLRPIQEDLWKVLSCTQIDAVVSPHFSRDPQLEGSVGRYNGGLFAIRNKNLLNEWRNLSLDESAGLYYEQQPLEYICENYLTLALPIVYNMSWWRINNKSNNFRLNKIALNKQSLLAHDGEAIICLHLHTFKRIRLF